MTKNSAPADEQTARRSVTVPVSMRGLCKIAPEPGAEIREVPVPSVGPADVLIRVDAASICGTDLHIYQWDEWARHRVTTPIVFGHEFAGHVVDVGAAVSSIKPGDYVAAESHVVCGACFQCRHGLAHICSNVQIIGVDRPGAFAEFISIPAENAWRTDSRFPPEIATIQEPMGNAVHTALSQQLAGANVVIFGAGPIGLFAVPIARACGAATILTVEPSAVRRELARTMGSDVVVDPTDESPVERVLEVTGGVGADVVLEMSGNGIAIRQAFELLRFGGSVALLGIPARDVQLDLADAVIFKGAIVRGISGRKLWETWYQTRGFLESGMDLSATITHRLPIDRFAEAFELVRTGRSGKVVLYPGRVSSSDTEEVA